MVVSWETLSASYSLSHLDRQNWYFDPVSSARSEINQTAGQNIRSIREKMGLSQDVFADRCGIHRTYVGAIERGESNITLDTLARVAAAAGIKPQALLNDPPSAASHGGKKPTRVGAPISRGKRK